MFYAVLYNQIDSYLYSSVGRLRAGSSSGSGTVTAVFHPFDIRSLPKDAFIKLALDIDSDVSFSAPTELSLNAIYGLSFSLLHNNTMSDLEMRRSSSDDVQIIACTEEQVAPIRRLCRTSPQRVVDMIRVQATAETAQVVNNIHANKEGNVIAALAAVGELVKGVHVSPDKMAIWKKLIDAGIVDSLVYNILNSTNFIETLPGMPEDLKERAMNQVNTISSLCMPYSDRIYALVDTGTLLCGSGDLIQRSAMHQS